MSNGLVVFECLESDALEAQQEKMTLIDPNAVVLCFLGLFTAGILAQWLKITKKVAFPKNHQN